MLKLSRHIRSGDLVAKHGAGFVRCGGRVRPFGVYQSGGAQTILTNSGWVRLSIPAGIVTHGATTVRVADTPMTTRARGRR